MIGQTQKGISREVTKFKNLYCYSLDGKAFDHRVQTLILLLSFNILESILNLSPKQVKIFRYCRNIELTLPLYHPSLRFVERYSGLSSGSGLTNTIGSISMYIMHAMCLFRYFSSKGINAWRVPFLIKVSGDDSVLGSKQPLNIKEYCELFKDMFSIELELELTSPPMQDKVLFLGSR